MWSPIARDDVEGRLRETLIIDSRVGVSSNVRVRDRSGCDHGG
jgi:hypothetical protein